MKTSPKRRTIKTNEEYFTMINGSLADLSRGLGGILYSLLRSLPRNIKKALIWCVTFFVLVIFGTIIITSLDTRLQGVLSSNLFKWLNAGVVEAIMTISRFSLCVAVLAVSVFASTTITKKFVTPIRKYDAKYLRNVLEAENPRFPAVTMDTLVKRMAGIAATEADRDDIKELILSKTKRITDFLASSCKAENTLLVGGIWGSGKTTSILLAIDELSDNQCEYSYIYESAFKYTGEMNSFEMVIISSIRNRLAGFNIKAASAFDGLLQNMTIGMASISVNLSKNNTKYHNLTTDYIDRINKAFDKKKRNIKLIVIVDDLDRLLGDEILSVLSLLSIVRRLKFVKIVLPVNTIAVVQHLKNLKLYEPELYIKKYLPEQCEVDIESTYKLVEDITFEFITKRLARRRRLSVRTANKQTSYIYDAVILKVLSTRFKNATRNSGLTTFGEWLLPIGLNTPELAKPLEDTPEYCLLQAPLEVYDKCSKRSIPLTWHDSKKDSMRFEDVVMGLVDKQGKLIFKDVDHFDSYTNYLEYVSPWLTNFAHEHWDELGINLREVLDVVESIEWDDLALGSMTFANTYNQLFPDNQITFRKIDE